MSGWNRRSPRRDCCLLGQAVLAEVWCDNLLCGVCCGCNKRWNVRKLSEIYARFDHVELINSWSISSQANKKSIWRTKLEFNDSIAVDSARQILSMRRRPGDGKTFAVEDMKLRRTKHNFSPLRRAQHENLCTWNLNHKSASTQSEAKRTWISLSLTLHPKKIYSVLTAHRSPPTITPFPVALRRRHVTRHKTDSKRRRNVTSMLSGQQ